VGILKWEVGPVVVPNERDYAAAKDAEVGKKEAEKLRSCEGGEKIESGKLEGGLGKKAECGRKNSS
jgi:hypothetical protein